MVGACAIRSSTYGLWSCDEWSMDCGGCRGGDGCLDDDRLLGSGARLAMSVTAVPVDEESASAPSSRYLKVLRRIPLAVWIVLVATLNAACWSVVTPPFQVTDEEAHFAYVKQLAETGELPRSVAGQISPEESTVLLGIHFFQVGGEPGPHTIASQAEQNQLQLDLERAASFPRDGSISAGVATSQPPLYYALESIPYLIARGGTVLDRLQLMRLLSAMMAGFTALFAFLFAREALPHHPWAWTTAGMGVAVNPLLVSMSGAVNPDSMLFAVSGALFFCLARGFVVV
jgi:hypothetical protein